MSTNLKTGACTLLLIVGSTVSLAGQTPPVEATPTQEGAAPAKSPPETPLALAQKKAAKDNKRVVAVRSGSKLDEALKAAGLRRLLLYEYEVVRLEADERPELGGFAILDAHGKVLTTAEDETIELQPLLEKCKAEPQDADKLLADALASATASNRRLLVHLGAPW